MSIAQERSAFVVFKMKLDIICNILMLICIIHNLLVAVNERAGSRRLTGRRTKKTTEFMIFLVIV